MKKKFLKTFLLGVLLSVFLTGCGLSIYEDWKASGGKAITGGGAIAGKDSLWYVMNIVEAVTFAVMIIIAAVCEKKLFSKSGGKVPEPKVRALDSKETDA